MKVVLQRVTQAVVTVSQKKRGSIGLGFVLLVGVAPQDTQAVFAHVARKIVNLRIFADPLGKMNLSLADVGGEVLVIPQFTLFAELKGQNRPYFGKAAPPEIARKLFADFVSELELQKIKKVVTGEFGMHMEIKLTNDGPVTLIIDSNSL